MLQAVEATAEAEQLVHKSTASDQAQAIVPITNYVVILSMNWAMHGQNSWQGDAVTVKYQDHTVWDTKFLDEVLRYFFHVAAAKSFPSLDEFAWRVDKVGLGFTLPQFRLMPVTVDCNFVCSHRPCVSFCIKICIGICQTHVPNQCHSSRPMLWSFRPLTDSVPCSAQHICSDIPQTNI